MFVLYKTLLNNYFSWLSTINEQYRGSRVLKYRGTGTAVLFWYRYRRYLCGTGTVGTFVVAVLQKYRYRGALLFFGGTGSSVLF